MQAKRKYNNVNLVISVLAVILAILTLTESLLDLSISLSSNYKWAIFLLCVGTAGIFGYRFFRKYSSPSHGKVGRKEQKKNTAASSIATQDASATSTNANDYLNASAIKPCFNNVAIFAGKFSVTLTKYNGQTEYDGLNVMQKIQWSLAGTNVGDEPLKAYSMLMTLSAFTPWEGESAVKLKAFLKKPGIRGSVPIKEQQIIINRLVKGKDTRMVTFTFPDGIACNRAERFKLTIYMGWRIECHFQNKEYYFTDPQNYGRQVDQLEIEIKTDMDEIMSREFTLYKVDRINRNFTPAQIEPKVDYDSKVVSWKVYNPSKDLFAVEIKNSATN